MIQFLAGFALALAVIMVWKLLVGREQAEGALLDSEVRFRAFMDNSPALAFVKDAAGCYRYINGPLERLFHIRFDAIKGKTDFDWLPEATAQRFHEGDAAVLANGVANETLAVLPMADGSARSWLVVKFPFRDSKGRALVGGVAVDLTEQERLRAQLAEQLRVANVLNEELSRANARLNELATTDGLTGLLNHRRFCETLELQFTYAQRQNQPLSVAMLDVDLFKQYNDEYGHQCGDEALAAVARLLKANSRGYDLVARYGGEEFSLILPATDTETAWLVCERLRAAIERAVWPLRPVSVSVGVATINDELQTPQELVEAADKALYTSKRLGRNRVTHHRDLDPEILPVSELDLIGAVADFPSF